MKNRMVLNIILLAAIAILAFVAFYKPGHENVHDRPSLTPVDMNSVSTILIKKEGSKDVLIKKTGDAWWIMEPVKARANVFMIESILQTLGAKIYPEFAAGNDLSHYGLDNPRPNITFDDQHKISFGAEHPLGERYYVLYDNKAYLIDRRFYRETTQAYTNFIDTTLFSDQDRIIAIKLPNFTIELSNGSWRHVTKNDEYTADQINALADQWRYAEAVSAGEFEGHRPALDKVVVTLEDKNGDQRKMEYTIASYRPEFILYNAENKMEYRFSDITGIRMTEIIK